MYGLFNTIVYPIRLVLGWISRVIPGFKRLANISVAGIIALLAFVFLATVLIIGIIGYINTDQRQTRGLQWILVVAVLMVVIPVCTYFFVKLLQRGETSPYPDIEKVWLAGLEKLAEQDVDLDDYPIFIVLGAADEKSVSRLLDGGQQSLIVHQTPSGTGPLHWFASEDAVYLSLTKASCLSSLAREHRGGRAGTVKGTGSAGSSGSARGTVNLMDDDDDYGSDMDAGGDAPVTQTVSEMPMAPSASGTLVPDDDDDDMFRDFDSAPTARPSVRSTNLSAQEADEQTDRLNYVCELLRKSRAPSVGINGVITVLPYSQVEQSGGGTASSLKRDLETMSAGLQIRFPVTAVVTGMEQDSGFAELARRIGLSKAEASRFGTRFDVWCEPTKDRLAAFSRHVVGEFANWIFRFFRKGDGLTKPGNRLLFAMLCRIRGRFAQGLEQVLGQGFGYDDSQVPEGMTPGFAGCYFVACGRGRQGMQQLFAKGVFDKLVDMEGELEWNGDALRAEKRRLQIANVVAFIGAISIVALGLLVAKEYGWFNWDKEQRVSSNRILNERSE